MEGFGITVELPDEDRLAYMHFFDIETQNALFQIAKNTKAILDKTTPHENLIDSSNRHHFESFLSWKLERIEVSSLLSFIGRLRSKLRDLGWKSGSLEDDLFYQKCDMASQLSSEGLYVHIARTILCQFSARLLLQKKEPKNTKPWPVLQHYYSFAQEYFKGNRELLNFLALISHPDSVSQFDQLVDLLNAKVQQLSNADEEEKQEIFEALNELILRQERGGRCF